MSKTSWTQMELQKKIISSNILTHTCEAKFGEKWSYYATLEVHICYFDLWYKI